MLRPSPEMRDIIGRYRITGKLGEGGMGVVFAAHDERLDRPVAIKTVRSGGYDRAAAERLRREARLAASLNHPGICQLYEIGEDEGELFVAMELLQGQSLAQRLASGPMTVTEAVPIALGFLQALTALHQHGLIHRDLKPSNIFLTPHGVKLLDFGIACRLEPPAGETAAATTAAGTMFGTPQYASPEQLRGESVDARGDIFAAGAVVYEMLAGRPPFRGISITEVLHRVLHEQPPALTGSAAIAAIDRILLRAMAKRAEERYTTAEAMAHDLREALLYAGAADAGARAVTRLIVLPLRVLRPDPDTDFLAFSLADAVTSSLSGLQSLVVRSSLAAMQFAASGDFKAIAREADVDVILAGTLLRAGDHLRVATQLVDGRASTVLWTHTAQAPVGDVFSVQDDLTQRIVQSLSLPLSAREQGMLKRDVPGKPQAYEHYLRANEMSRDPKGWQQSRDLYLRCLEEDPQYAPAWAGLGRMYRMIAKYVDPTPDENLGRAESALKRALELNPDLSFAENVYAQLEVDLGRAPDAMVRLVRRIRERSADPQLYAGLVHVCRYCGLLRASLAAHDRARRLDPAIQPSVAHTYFMLGDYARVLEFDAEGIPYVRKLALVMMGREREALEALSVIDERIPTKMVRYTAALRLLLQGDVQRSAGAILEVGLSDPEAAFYVGRHLARVGDVQSALAILAKAVSDGFFCVPVFARDPWLDPLRTMPEFAAIVAKAEARHREAAVAFLAAEGDRSLGIHEPI